MTVIVIIIALIFLFFGGTRKKKINKQTVIGGETLSNSSSLYSTNMEGLRTKIDPLQPNRINAIDWHIKAIEKGYANGDLNLINLSYAKLIESIRQQNENEKGNYEQVLAEIRKEYELFREIYRVEYPKQFLPPSQRQQETTSKKLSERDRKDLRSYLEAEDKAISDIKLFFKLAGNTDGFNREFWIVERGESELLAKTISVYFFW